MLEQTNQDKIELELIITSMNDQADISGQRTEVSPQEDNKENVHHQNKVEAGGSRRQTIQKPLSPTNHSMYQLFNDVVLQRRQTSFDRLRDWELKRSDSINNYRAVCEKVLTALDLKASISTSSFDTIVNFFETRREQEEHYHQSLTKKSSPLGQLFEDKDAKPQHRGVLPFVLKECDEFHIRHAKSSKDIASFIEQRILKSTLHDCQKAFSKLITSSKESFIEARRDINTINSKTQSKTRKYSNFYSEIMGESKKKKKKFDSYYKELAIMASAQKQIQEHLKFGKLVIEYWEALVKLERSRYQSLKKCVSLYLNRMTEIYGKSFSQPDIPLKSMETFNPDEEVAKIYHIHNIFDAASAELICRERKVSSQVELDFKIVKDFFFDLTLSLLNSQPLVVKEWLAKKESGILKSWKTCQIVITVDGNILLVDKSEPNVFKKPDAVIKMERSNMKLRKDNEIEIIESVPGIILNTKSKYLIKFDSNDQMEEFLHQINNTKF